MQEGSVSNEFRWTLRDSSKRADKGTAVSFLFPHCSTHLLLTHSQNNGGFSSSSTPKNLNLENEIIALKNEIKKLKENQQVRGCIICVRFAVDVYG